MSRIFLLGVLALPLLLVACSGGDDDPASIDEYLANFAEARGDFLERGDQLNQDFDDALDAAGTGDEAAADRVQVDALRTFVADGRALLRDHADAVDALDPPGEAAEPHERYLSATRDAASAYDGLAGQLDGVDDIGRASQIVGQASGELDDAEQRQRDACKELQQLANDGGFDLDLRCQQ